MKAGCEFAVQNLRAKVTFRTAASREPRPYALVTKSAASVMPNPEPVLAFLDSELTSSLSRDVTSRRLARMKAIGILWFFSALP